MCLHTRNLFDKNSKSCLKQLQNSSTNTVILAKIQEVLNFESSKPIQTRNCRTVLRPLKSREQIRNTREKKKTIISRMHSSIKKIYHQYDHLLEYTRMCVFANPREDRRTSRMMKYPSFYEFIERIIIISNNISNGISTSISSNILASPSKNLEFS